ncbi:MULTISPECIES: hypothetical protein [unclassified Leucobacter]|uniref:hypothetical protein n=1 Tax=unclassified Leucobacter TaxID=2621730 RepID=UPI00165E8C00|nr:MULTISPECIES: hypothetical protein [unclassified Leucobacter]MBC9928095.1 hypothetical protein [Leucobacter sp. cx-169]
MLVIEHDTALEAFWFRGWWGITELDIARELDTYLNVATVIRIPRHCGVHLDARIFWIFLIGCESEDD